MTEVAIPLTGAPKTSKFDWNVINWHKAEAHVRRLQMRIAKAFREGKRGRAKALQWILTHSFYARLLAVKRVSQNKGGKIPGVDKVVWRTPGQKMQATQSLERKGYKTQPLKRIYIPKKRKGKLRPLSIPAMKCRGMQALHLLTLEPIVETIADKNAYGFRPLRSTADAIEQCFNVLAKRRSAPFILEGDIKACFDTISHKWLLENVPMDTEILKKWLNAGYIEKGRYNPTNLGTPQGGLISPALLNVTLSGLERAVKTATSPKDKVNICIYADDFIITGATKEVLEGRVKPAVEEFMRERGLELSKDKTKIVHINEGFDFLGFNIRKYKGKLIIRPAKDNIKKFVKDVRDIIRDNKTIETEKLIQILNSKIRGWANHYSHVCSKETYGYVSSCIFKAIWKWAKRRHPTKNARWVRKKYFRSEKNRHWIFSTKAIDKEGNRHNLDLMEIMNIPIRRHTKIKADATPYDPDYREYLEKRSKKRKATPKQVKRKKRWLSWWECLNE